MHPLMLNEVHRSLGARFAERNGNEIIHDYGDWRAEHAALHASAGVVDLSFRSRFCLVGGDRARFLHGQVTNDVKKLRTGEGCYAAITTAKGKMEGDLNIFALAEELLVDAEPGLTGNLSARLEKYIVADDVQIVDAAPHYGLLSVLGPKAEAVIHALGLFAALPAQPLGSVKVSDPTLGEIYLINNPRLSSFCTSRSAGAPAKEAPPLARMDSCPFGFDLFVPNHSLGAVADKLIAAAKAAGGRAIGDQAFEAARIEAGIPRFGADMDAANLPLECGIESRAVTYSKGCYIGQEVINRIHSVGHVNRELRGLRLEAGLKELPVRGDRLFHAGREVGHVTSAVNSPRLNANIALGYVRREVFQMGNLLTLPTASGESAATLVELPFA